MSNEYLDWKADQEEDEAAAKKIVKKLSNTCMPKNKTTIVDGDVEVCDDCHGGLNSHGKHLDCRSCGDTGIKPKPLNDAK